MREISCYMVRFDNGTCIGPFQSADAAAKWVDEHGQNFSGYPSIVIVRAP